MLTALSLGAGGGAGFRPAGRFVGGAGGVGLARAVGIGRVAVPFETTPFAVAGGGWTTVAGGGGGGVGLGVLWGVRYAEGAHPCAEPSSFLASHQPSRIY